MTQNNSECGELDYFWTNKMGARRKVACLVVLKAKEFKIRPSWIKNKLNSQGFYEWNI